MESGFSSQITIDGKVVRIATEGSGLPELLMPLQAPPEAGQRFGTNQEVSLCKL